MQLSCLLHPSCFSTQLNLGKHLAIFFDISIKGRVHLRVQQNTKLDYLILVEPFSQRELAADYPILYIFTIGFGY